MFGQLIPVLYQLGNTAHDAHLLIDHCLQVSFNENKLDLESISFNIRSILGR